MPYRAGTFRLSGGAANTDPGLSLGGIESVNGLGLQSVSFVTTPAGVTVLGGYGVPAGAGRVEIDHDSIAPDHQFKFVAPFSIESSANLTRVSNGSGVKTYLLEDSANSDFLLAVTIDEAALTASGAESHNLTVEQSAVQLFGDISEVNSKAGQTVYRCLYFSHDDVQAHDVEFYVGSENAAPEAIEIGTTQLISGSVEPTIASETDPPAGVSNWGFYPTAGSPLTVTVNAGESIGLWIKRSINPLNGVSKPYDDVNIIARVI